MLDELVCVRTTDSKVSCWGPGGRDGKVAPTVIPELEGMTSLALDGGQLVAVLTDGSIVRSDYHSSIRSLVEEATFTTVPGEPQLMTATNVVPSHTHSCDVLPDGGVVCWGYNRDGQLGDGTFVDRPTATPVIGIRNQVVAIEASPPSDVVMNWDDLPEGCSNQLRLSYHGGAARISTSFETVSAYATASTNALRVELANYQRDPTQEDRIPGHEQIRLGLHFENLASDQRIPAHGLQPKVKYSYETARGRDWIGRNGWTKITYRDKDWVCGTVGYSTKATHIRGSFAARIVAEDPR